MVLISSQLIGDYNKTNILAACEIGHYFKISLEKIKEAIESYTPSNNRSQLLKTKNTIVLMLIMLTLVVCRRL